MKKRLFALLLTLCMAFTFLPMTALAAGGTSETDKVTTSDELKAAIKAASDGATIYLGEGTFSTYDIGEKINKKLTFVGSGTGTTVWQVGPSEDRKSAGGSEYNADYTFDGSDSITFKNMTLLFTQKDESGNTTWGDGDYRGFVRINNLQVENCNVDGQTCYWGYETTTFTNTTFNATGYNALWTYAGTSYTFAVRYAATDNYNASDSSSTATFSTTSNSSGSSSGSSNSASASRRQPIATARASNNGSAAKPPRHYRKAITA